MHGSHELLATLQSTAIMHCAAVPPLLLPLPPLLLPLLPLLPELPPLDDDASVLPASCENVGSVEAVLHA
jgi:hypothetical protein